MSLDTRNDESARSVVYRIESLAEHHRRQEFSCGNESLDRFLHQIAGQHGRRGYARTYVLVTTAEPDRVLGYYAISPAEIDLVNLPPEIAKKLPRAVAIPAILLGRLAVARDQQGRKLGRQLLFDALERALHVKAIVGGWAVIVDAIDDDAVSFYERFGFRSFPDSPRRLFLELSSFERAFKDSSSTPG